MALKGLLVVGGYSDDEPLELETGLDMTDTSEVEVQFWREDNSTWTRTLADGSVTILDRDPDNSVVGVRIFPGDLISVAEGLLYLWEVRDVTPGRHLRAKRGNFRIDP
jgi:hypothetical protein